MSISQNITDFLSWLPNKTSDTFENNSENSSYLNYIGGVIPFDFEQIK